MYSFLPIFHLDYFVNSQLFHEKPLKASKKMRRLETVKKERRNHWSQREQMGKERLKWSRLENRKKKKWELCKFTEVVKIKWIVMIWENPSKIWCLTKLCQHDQALKWSAFYSLYLLNFLMWIISVKMEVVCDLSYFYFLKFPCKIFSQAAKY